MREGFPLAGEMLTAGVFRKKEDHEVEVGADVAWLDDFAEDLRDELVSSYDLSEANEIERAIYEITNGEFEGGNEVERGWAEGPHTAEEITEGWHGQMGSSETIRRFQSFLREAALRSKKESIWTAWTFLQCGIQRRRFLSFSGPTLRQE